jgi:hypothetical protein
MGLLEQRMCSGRRRHPCAVHRRCHRGMQ